MPDDFEILADRDAFKQVMLILLDNAVKHSQGEIDVSASRKAERVEVRVQDYGGGIAPEILPHIIDRFYRADDRNHIPGFGLGLPIAKTLVEGLGGKIAIESQPVYGSTVIMHLPLFGPTP